MSPAPVNGPDYSVSLSEDDRLRAMWNSVLGWQNQTWAAFRVINRHQRTAIEEARRQQQHSQNTRTHQPIAGDGMPRMSARWYRHDPYARVESTSRVTYPAHVGGHDLGHVRGPMGSFSRVCDPGGVGAGGGHECLPVHRVVGNEFSDAAPVREDAACALPSVRVGRPVPVDDGCGPPAPRRPDTGTPSPAHHIPRAPAPAGAPPDGRSAFAAHVGLGLGVPLGRHLQPRHDVVPGAFSEAHNYSLVRSDQDVEGRSFSSVGVHGGGGKVHGGDPQRVGTAQCDESRCSHHNLHDGRTRQAHESGRLSLDGPLVQTGGGDGVGLPSGGRTVRRNDVAPLVEAQNAGGAECNDDTLRFSPRGLGFSAGDTALNDPSLEIEHPGKRSKYADCRKLSKVPIPNYPKNPVILPKTDNLLDEGLEAIAKLYWPQEPVDDDRRTNGGFATITNNWRRPTTVAPRTSTAPLHSCPISDIGNINVAEARKRLSPSQLRRFDEVWRMAFFTDVEVSNEPRLKLRPEHAAKMKSDGLASIVPKDKLHTTTGWCEAFTVLEEKNDAERQRMILWCRALNCKLEDLYKPQVPLQHVSAYFNAVLADLGGVRDLKLGFYQVEIPAAARHRFRFMDENGVVYELNRLPMGHTCAPEIMTILMCAIAGDPAYCSKPASAPFQVQLDIWIDSVRAAGAASQVTGYMDWVDLNAKSLGAVWNAADSIVGTAYTYIGVQFDHRTKQICSKLKVIRKIDKIVDQSSYTISELEGLCGRLRHVSAICGIDISEYYVFLKILRRRLSQVNRKLADRNHDSELPPSAMTALKRWMRLCIKNEARVIPPRPSSPHSKWALFTDASLTGHGSVLIDRDSQQIRVAGGRWDVPALNINAAEQRTVVLGVAAFQHLFVRGSVVDIFIDNTSTIAGCQKGYSKSFVMNEEIKKLVTLLKAAGIIIRVQYVPSKLNLADAKSRE